MTSDVDNVPSESPASNRQFSMRVLMLLPVAVALPFAFGYWFSSPMIGLVVLFIEVLTGLFYPPTRVFTAVFCVPLFVIALLLPVQSRARAPARQSQCTNNMKQIGLAFYKYHDAYGCFPPAYVAD